MPKRAPRRMAVHMRDIRLMNNAGMFYPVCRANREKLDTSFVCKITAHVDQVTCKNCLREYPRQYPWATQKKV
jgi:hypothetical protein